MRDSADVFRFRAAADTALLSRCGVSYSWLTRMAPSLDPGEQALSAAAGLMTPYRFALLFAAEHGLASADRLPGGAGAARAVNERLAALAEFAASVGGAMERGRARIAIDEGTALLGIVDNGGKLGFGAVMEGCDDAPYVRLDIGDAVEGMRRRLTADSGRSYPSGM